MGGIETMLVNIANEQAGAGADVSVIVVNDLVDPTLESALSAKVTLYKLRRKVGSKNPLPVLRLNALLARIRPDVVHMHSASLYRYVLLPSARRRLCCTLHFMTNPDTPIRSDYHVFAISDAVRDDLKEKYGICPFQESAKQYLFFIPLVLLASTNLWWGVRLKYTPAETALYVISMLCVGFLEEVIFRGFLFKALCRTNVKQAVVISSVTFGIGHIVNLLNGRDIPETILQICYAVAIGFLFTILFLRGKSLWPCILTHSAINSLSAFANDGGAPAWHGIAGSAFLCLVSLAYVWYILRATKKEQVSHE